MYEIEVIEHMSEKSNRNQKKPRPAKVTDERDNKSERFSMRMYSDDYQKLVYWADAYGMDRTELLVAAMHHYIRWRNGDYDLPNAETQRLNQLIDAINNLIVTNQHLEKSVINGFDAMLGIIRGDNYLVEKDDGEL